jgi:polysaccharide export outer membrane protein
VIFGGRALHTLKGLDGFRKHSNMERMRTIAIVFILGFLTICLVGCNDKFMNPTAIGRFRPVPAVNVILDSLGVAEETPSEWAGAEEPKPADVVPYETDYVFGSGDVVRISIFELRQEGEPYINDYIVTETGKLSLPDVGIVQASGLTESQLEEEIKQILSPSVLKEPMVTVILLNSLQRVFSIWGNGVPNPGRMPIPRYDFRLIDALATARVATQFNVSYIYVSRPITGKEEISEPLKQWPVAEPGKTEELAVPKDEMLEIIAPRAQRQQAELVIASSEMIGDKELTEAAIPEGFEPLADAERSPMDVNITERVPAKTMGPETIEEPIATEQKVEWIFREGKWVPVQVGKPVPMKMGQEAVKAERPKVSRPPKEKVPSGYGTEQAGTGGTYARVIKIPTDKLAGGDPRYNIIIKPGDSVNVPNDMIGEFCVMGNTNQQGFIPLTGRPLTLRMAIAAAGGLGPLAWPKRVEVTRRIARNKEETVMVDLEKIASGEQPDFFIKPLDTINVGTHPSATFRAVMRNAFRATYGFGFLYDRNFAERNFSIREPLGPFLGPSLF